MLEVFKIQERALRGTRVWLVPFLVGLALWEFGCEYALGLQDTEHATDASDASVEANAGNAGSPSTGGTGGMAGASGGATNGGTAGANTACFPPKKFCDGACVLIDDPNYGCSQDGCDPCPAVENTNVSCVNHVCVATNCEKGWGDCDGKPENGCEDNLEHDLNNCGSCGHSCSNVLNVATVQCENGKCTYDHCLDGYDDCDGDPSNGCETDIWDVDGHCGSCTAGPCNVDHGIPTCPQGICMPNDCNSGWQSCPAGANDCKTHVAVDMDNCGDCGKSCHHETTGHANTKCDEGQCKLVSCIAPYADCDGKLSNWCEANTQSNPDTCGSCSPCAGSTSHVSKRVCEKGMCAPLCESGWGDCDGPAPGNSDNGCETSLNTIDNCGACGHKCSGGHIKWMCEGGNCVMKSCAGAWGDCDKNQANGCETDLTTTKNCGSCFNDCAMTVRHVLNVTCENGACGYDNCATGFADCDSDRSNGCECQGTCGGPGQCDAY